MASLNHVMKISERKYYQQVCNRDIDIVLILSTS